MKINCLGCGHYFVVDSAYANYDGQMKCNTCGTILSVKTEEGAVKSASIVALSRRVSGSTEKPAKTQVGQTK